MAEEKETDQAWDFSAAPSRAEAREIATLSGEPVAILRLHCHPTPAERVAPDSAERDFSADDSR